MKKEERAELRTEVTAAHYSEFPKWLPRNTVLSALDALDAGDEFSDAVVAAVSRSERSAGKERDNISRNTLVYEIRFALIALRKAAT